MFVESIESFRHVAPRHDNSYHYDNFNYNSNYVNISLNCVIMSCYRNNFFISYSILCFVINYHMVCCSQIEYHMF